MLTCFEYLYEHSDNDILEYVIEESSFKFCIDLLENNYVDELNLFISLVENNLENDEIENILLENFLYYVESESRIYSNILFEYIDPYVRPEDERFQSIQQNARFANNLKSNNDSNNSKKLYNDATDNTKTFASPESKSKQDKLKRQQEKPERLKNMQDKINAAKQREDNRLIDKQNVREELRSARLANTKKKQEIQQNRIQAKKEMETHHKQYDDYKPDRGEFHDPWRETKFDPHDPSGNAAANKGIFNKLKKFGGKIRDGIKKGINYFRKQPGQQTSQFRQAMGKRLTNASNYLAKKKENFIKKRDSLLAARNLNRK